MKTISLIAVINLAVYREIEVRIFILGRIHCDFRRGFFKINQNDNVLRLKFNASKYGSRYRVLSTHHCFPVDTFSSERRNESIKTFTFIIQTLKLKRVKQSRYLVHGIVGGFRRLLRLRSLVFYRELGLYKSTRSWTI